MAENLTTTIDHETIRRWMEERGARPAAVKNTLAGDEAGVLYVDFPGAADKDVDELSWETFFKVFDRQNLALRYENMPASGDGAPRWDLVDRDTGESVRA
jgi:hypothetical protein